MRSDDFRERWASQDVSQYRRGTQRFRHPLVGELELAYEALAVTAALDEIIIVYTAEPNSPTHDALQRLLADGAERERLRAAAREAAATTYSWERIAAAHLALYARLQS